MSDDIVNTITKLKARMAETGPHTGSLWVSERDLAAIVEHFDQCINNSNVPVHYYSRGMTYAVYGSSSISYVEHLHCLIDKLREACSQAVVEHEHRKYHGFLSPTQEKNLAQLKFVLQITEA